MSKANKAKRSKITKLLSNYYPHTKSISERKWSKEYIQILAIDPATVNYAIRVERRYSDGTIKPVLFDKVDLSLDSKGIKSSQEPDVLVALTKYLNQWKSIYQECHYFLIERQMSVNYKATRIGQHTLSYFLINMTDAPLLPDIIEMHPKVKGNELGGAVGLSYDQLKQWSVGKAIDMLNVRGDTFSIEVLEYFKKKRDDLSDCICMIEAAASIYNLPLTKAKGKTNTIKDSNKPKIKLIKSS